MTWNPNPLKTLMQAEGRRQSWLATQIGKDQAEVSRIVNRGLVPDQETQRAIAKALKREVEEFWPQNHHESPRAAA